MRRILLLILWGLCVRGENNKTLESTIYWNSFRPEYGNEINDKCEGRIQQSPIDLPRNGIKATLEDFSFNKYTLAPSKYSMINNGHTAKVFQMKGPSMPPFVFGGGLNSLYEFAQLHFHWGNSSQSGSEHTIDGLCYPLELHLVHFNSHYGNSLSEAVKKGNGSLDTLAVLAVLFKLQKNDNPGLSNIVDNLYRVRIPNKMAYISGFALRDLLPKDAQSYYRYMGSLTTPPCDQIVVWTVFKEIVGVSERQLQKFRELHTRDSNLPLVNTYRNVQTTNGRLIYEVSSNAEYLGSKDGRIGFISQLLQRLTKFINNVNFNFYSKN